MSRKDTILIAVLVNAALLVVLFVTAIKSDDTVSHQADKPIAAVKSISLPSEAKRTVNEAKGDEVDQVLREFSQKGAVAQAQQQDSSKAKVDFAKELQALTKTASQKNTTAARSKQNAQYLEVTVKKGDALAKIARAHSTSVDEIMRANHLNSTMLRIGQILKVPRKGNSATAAAPQSTNSSRFYTVKQGDNPWTIAVKNHIQVDDLLKLNDLNEDKARRLKPGDQLRIR